MIDLNKCDRVFIDWNFDLNKTAPGQAVYLYALKDLVKIEKILGKDTQNIEEEIEKKSVAAEKMFDEKKGSLFSAKTSTSLMPRRSG